MIDSTAANLVTIGQLAFRVVLRNIYNQVELMFGNHCHYIILRIGTFIRPEHSFGAYTVRIEECSGTCRSVNLISLRKKHAAGIQQVHFRFHCTGREHHTFFWTRNLETGSNHGIQQCFGEVVADTAYLPRRRHIHAQYRVCVMQAGE